MHSPHPYRLFINIKLQNSHIHCQLIPLSPFVILSWLCYDVCLYVRNKLAAISSVLHHGSKSIMHMRGVEEFLLLGAGRNGRRTRTRNRTTGFVWLAFGCIKWKRRNIAVNLYWKKVDGHILRGQHEMELTMNIVLRYRLSVIMLWVYHVKFYENF